MRLKNNYNEGKVIIKTRFLSKLLLFNFRRGRVPQFHPLDLRLTKLFACYVCYNFSTLLYLVTVKVIVYPELCLARNKILEGSSSRKRVRHCFLGFLFTRENRVFSSRSMKWWTKQQEKILKAALISFICQQYLSMQVIPLHIISDHCHQINQF